MGRPSVAYMNECRAIRRQTGIRKSKWKAPERAPAEPVKPGERISRSYAMLLAVKYHRRRQAEIEQAKHFATLEDFQIPF
jgi:hypothetical protein